MHFIRPKTRHSHHYNSLKIQTLNKFSPNANAISHHYQRDIRYSETWSDQMTRDIGLNEGQNGCRVDRNWSD